MIEVWYAPMRVTRWIHQKSFEIACSKYALWIGMHPKSNLWKLQNSQETEQILFY
mgnify:CR=1 FL=1